MRINTFLCGSCAKTLPETLNMGGLCATCRSNQQHDDFERTRKEEQQRDEKEREAFAAFAKAQGSVVKEPQNIAVQELAERQLCRRRLLPFIKRFMPSYQAGWVHKEICAELEQFSQDVVDKKSPRLMLFMPPRSGKSEIVSRNFPAWHLGQHPEHEFISTSYSGSLALKFSRKVRSMLREPSFDELFPTCKLDPDTQSVEFWQTTKGGAYMAAGVSGPLTGNGMHIGVIDDPVKNREEAESANVRQSAKEWYTSTFYTRLAPGAGILIVLTRWHHDDLAGWLLEEQKRGGDQWKTVVYPAIAEEDEAHRKQGEALHPERYDLEALNRIRRAVGPRDWQALYQQKPTADEGDYFHRGWFKYYNTEELPDRELLTTYQAWDLAIGTRDTNDWSVGITIGIDRDENAYILDLARGRWDAYELVEQILDAGRLWAPDHVGIERGQISMALGPMIEKRIEERKQYDFPYDPNGLKTGRADKQARARPVQGRMRQGRVKFPADAPWLNGLIAEMLSFPSGVHDDQVDALAWVFQMLSTFTIANLPKTPTAPSWRDKILQTKSGKSAMSA